MNIHFVLFILDIKRSYTQFENFSRGPERYEKLVCFIMSQARFFFTEGKHLLPKRFVSFNILRSKFEFIRHTRQNNNIKLLSVS